MPWLYINAVRQICPSCETHVNPNKCDQILRFFEMRLCYSIDHCLKFSDKILVAPTSAASGLSTVSLRLARTSKASENKLEVTPSLDSNQHQREKEVLESLYSSPLPFEVV